MVALFAWPTASVFAQAGAAGPSGGGAAVSTPQPAPPLTWSFRGQDVSRVESWRFFEPHPGGGDPDYVFLGNRLLLGARATSARMDVDLAVQHVGFLGLPDQAAGPGALGTGALYFAQGGRRERPQQLYLRYATVRFKALAPGLDVQVGRMAYASGAESATTVGKVEAVRRMRLNARLVGEFEWSLYQRGYDGVRIDLTRPSWRLTGIAFMPTQGGFAREANQTMTDVVVAGATASSQPTGALGRSQVQAFVLRYGDDRKVTGRPDNTGLAAPRAEVGITTVGATWLGAYPAGSGEVDTFAWTALQRGNWYGQDHAGSAVAAELGYQWTDVSWAPWIRGGVFRASGDDDPTDGTHGTFFPMLPTVRRFSMTTAYSTMNLRDTFVQAILRPTDDLNLRLDVHDLGLVSSADRWYAGSGATLSSGGNFGYVSRPSNGSTDLGTSVELSATYTITPRWSVNGFAAHLSGGDVVTRTFRGHRLWFLYAESVVRLDGPWH